MTDIPADAAKPAAKSLTLQSIVAIALVAGLGPDWAVLPEGTLHDVAGAAIDFLSMIGLVGAAVGRARAKTPIG